ncbi:MAG: c-type cytochrome [Anaerolineales bacterium]|nr:c-type cytochrome [Anaerolineales bacterium]
MDDQHKEQYKERYESAKQRGVKFFPDIIYKDMIVAFGVFLLVIGLATFVGVKPEAPADPSDSSYIPRPEWYFLFLFQLLKYFPGKIEWIGTTVVPVVAVLALLLLPFYDRNPSRHWSKRKMALAIMSVAVIGIVALTVVAAVTTPPQEEFSAFTSVVDQFASGEELYGIQCVECHGTEGEGGEITTVEGLEGVVVAPMNAPDFIYTRTDDTIFNVIDYGQQDLGMPPFGLAYGGELEKAEIDAIVTFMRYAWDDRVELPEEAVVGVPELGPDEVPVYTVHVEPIIRRTCLSCHRPGKKNGNYLMRDYNEVITSGDYAPNFIAGDLSSNAIRMIHREEIDAGGPMPPTKALKEEWVDIFERWVVAGMPETPEDLPTPEPTEGIEATPEGEATTTPEGQATPQATP